MSHVFSVLILFHILLPYRPSSIMSVERPQADGRSESRELSSLTVKIPLSKLSRIPAVSSVVTTRGVGMFRDKAVQAERGMFVDKDVRDQ